MPRVPSVAVPKPQKLLPRMPMQRSTKQRARLSPETHSFSRGVGYIEHTSLPVNNPGPYPATLCVPPAEAGDGTLHILQPPGGAAPIKFRWLKTKSVWAVESGASMRSNRLGYPAAYLSAAGWTYKAAVNS